MGIQRTSPLLSLMNRHCCCLFGRRSAGSVLSVYSAPSESIRRFPPPPTSSPLHTSAALGSTPLSHRNDLMEFPRILSPSYLNFMKGFFMVYTVIRPSFDRNFSSRTILTGARQAMITVASCLVDKRLSDLAGLVSEEALDEIRRKLPFICPEVQQRMTFEPKHIVASFIYETGVIIEGEAERQKRWVEVTVCTYINHKFADGMAFSDLSKISVSNSLVCNMRMIREYTKHVEDSWTVNMVNFFLASDE